MSTTYPRDELEFKHDGRITDKDDYKRQSVEARTGLKAKAMDIREQVMSSEIGQRIMNSDVGQKAAPVLAAGMAKAKEAIAAGKVQAKEAYAVGMEKGKEAYATGMPMVKEYAAVGMEKGKEAIAAGQAKIAELQQKDAQLTAASETLLPADRAGMFSPVQRDADVGHRKVHHTSAADFSFSSIPDDTSAPKPVVHSSPIVREEETQPLLQHQASSSGGMSDPIPLSILDRGTSGDPLPAQADLPESIGLHAGAGLEYIKERAAPQVAKAKSLYSLWKNGESGETTKTASTGESKLAQAQEVYTTSVKPALESVASQAQHLYHEQVLPAASAAIKSAGQIYNDTIQPKMAAGLSAAQEQVAAIQEKGVAETISGLQRRGQESVANVQATVAQTIETKTTPEQRQKLKNLRADMGAKMRLGWNKTLDVWEAQQPALREAALKGKAIIKRNKLELPLMALGTLLLLWAGMALVGLAFPKTQPNQVVPYNPDLVHSTPIIQTPIERSTGPIQGAAGPGLMDKAKMKLDSADAVLRDGMQDVKARAAGVVDSVQDAIPSGADIKATIDSGLGDLKARAADMKDTISEQLPSTADIKSRAADLKDSIQEQMPSTADLKSRAADLKDSVSAQMPSTHDVKVQSASLGSKIRSGMENIKESELLMKLEDRLVHAKNLLPEQLNALRHSIAQLKGHVVNTMTPQQHWILHSDVLNADDHVIEHLDAHHHVKETLDL